MQEQRHASNWRRRVPLSTHLMTSTFSNPPPDLTELRHMSLNGVNKQKEKVRLS